MSNGYTAVGLTGSWINAWLAAIGVTVLVPGVTVRWVDEHQPVAVFSGDDLVNRIADALPTSDDLATLTIATTHEDSTFEFPRKPTFDAYRDRCVIARQRGDFSLWCTVTDFVTGDDTELAHSPFDPSAPRGITIHDRLVSCRHAIHDAATMIEASLNGVGTRHQINGLGFDYRRIMQSTIPGQAPFADPVIELLAFYGLAVIPVRGDRQRTLTRGWVGRPTRRGSFTWPLWTPPLTPAGIDALLDQHWTGGTVPTLATFTVVPYQQRSTMDATRGFASERQS